MDGNNLGVNAVFVVHNVLVVWTLAYYFDLGVSDVPWFTSALNSAACSRFRCSGGITASLYTSDVTCSGTELMDDDC